MADKAIVMLWPDHMRGIVAWRQPITPLCLRQLHPAPSSAPTGSKPDEQFVFRVHAREIDLNGLGVQWSGASAS